MCGGRRCNPAAPILGGAGDALLPRRRWMKCAPLKLSAEEILAIGIGRAVSNDSGGILADGEPRE